MTGEPLSLQALNRATLDRQLLLHRATLHPAEAVAHLAGMQSQAPLAPYVGLWTRLAGFRPAHLENLMTERAVVRAHVMRNTVHLVAARDFSSFRPLFQPLIERALRGNFGRRLAGVDLPAVARIASALLAERPLTRVQIAAELAPHWPDHDPASLAYAATHLLPLVQVPPRGLWAKTGPATFSLASAWLAGADSQDCPPALPPADPAAVAAPPAAVAAPPADPAAVAPSDLAAPAPSDLAAPAPSDLVAPEPSDLAAAAEQLVLRYLAAYGPASVADIQAWSGLSRLREVTERLSGRLRPFAGPDGAQLLDLPDAPRPDPDVAAPPRFLPAYDNLLLSFADRSRVIPHDRPVPLPPGNGASTGTLLTGGRWQANWKITRGEGQGDKRQAVLLVQPFVRLGTADREAIEAQGAALLAFAAAGADVRDVQFAPVG